MLIVIDKVKPGHDMQKHARISRLSGSSSLHIFGQSRLSVQRFPSLDLFRHFSHVHFDFPPVFRETVEAVERGGVEIEEACNESDGALETHNLRETTPAYFGGGNALEPVHEGGASGGDSCGAGVVRGAGIADNALEMRVTVDELFAGVSVGVVVE